METQASSKVATRRNIFGRESEIRPSEKQFLPIKTKLREELRPSVKSRGSVQMSAAMSELSSIINALAKMLLDSNDYFPSGPKDLEDIARVLRTIHESHS